VAARREGFIEVVTFERWAKRKSAPTGKTVASPTWVTPQAALEQCHPPKLREVTGFAGQPAGLAPVSHPWLAGRRGRRAVLVTRRSGLLLHQRCTGSGQGHPDTGRSMGYHGIDSVRRSVIPGPRWGAACRWR
jgi:hypothetical protein